MGRKQSHSAEAAWRRRLASFRKSKLSVLEFCRQQGVSTASFYQWRRRLREDASNAKAARQPIAEEALPAKAFVPLKVSASSAEAEVEFPNGVRIRVPATNTEALRVALQIGHELYSEAS